MLAEFWFVIPIGWALLSGLICGAVIRAVWGNNLAAVSIAAIIFVLVFIALLMTLGAPDF